MPAKLGFLTVRRHEELGYFGGYLVVNHLARPLEFHCTLPMRPSRAQAILYGPTIEDFVCGEQIGTALISRAKTAVDLVVTDSPTVLAVSIVSDQPIVQLDRAASQEHACDQDPGTQPGMISAAFQIPTQSVVGVSKLSLGGNHFLLPERGQNCRLALEKTLEELGENFDFREPFGRIVEALAEANPGTKAA